MNSLRGHLGKLLYPFTVTVLLNTSVTQSQRGAEKPRTLHAQAGLSTSKVSPMTRNFSLSSHFAQNV